MESPQRIGVLAIDGIGPPVCYWREGPDIVLCVLGCKPFPLRWASAEVELAIAEDMAVHGPV